jgi:GrpB-like predicted nucleotidyltransferase (UPF0157 family)
MLGLKRGIVELVPHDVGWATKFNELAAMIRSRTGLPEDRVQHVGSTAVEGIPSKPILDIVLGPDSGGATDRLAAALVGIGYIDRGLGEGSNGRLLVMESAPNVRIAHVHIVQYETQDWKDYVVFRDTLRGDHTLRSRYAELKRGLAERFATDQQSYTSGKETFIRAVIHAAQAGTNLRTGDSTVD